MLLEIPRGFEKAQANEQSPAALIAVNTVNGTKGGLFTPISSMPEWAQGITYLNPLRYFMETMRMVYLKGSGICDIGFQLSVLSSFAFLLYAWAIRSYRKQQ